MAVARRLPIGTEVSTGHREPGSHARVWAPDHARITLVVEGDAPREVVLAREPDGHHAGFIPGLVDGGRYRFRLGDDPALYADPASRFQPDGPLGSSQVVDPSRFAWTDAAWRGIAPDRHVLYELHVGTFTREGTYRAAAGWLDYFVDLGITTLELMPIAELAGGYGWGYDGVNWFAPYHPYGTPDDLRAFIDRAHARGLAVILDVVYNHLGPAGNHLFTWAPTYRVDARNDWGDTLNFGDAGMRELVIANAGYWIDEFHFDGLRLDATQAIHDRSPRHIVGELAARARAAAGDRTIFLVAENEPQDAALVGPEIGLDAMWNDDFHHAARVALAGLREGYLHDYHGTPQELLSAVKRGFLYQGQLYPWQKQPRGTPTRGLPRHRFVHFLENHDQVSNIGFGERLAVTADAGVLRALTAVLLLSPELPMLFQGQEHAAAQPWQFFANHADDLHAPIRTGRAKFMAQFEHLATEEAQAALPDPNLRQTFEACRLDPSERRLDHPHALLHKDLLRLRRDDPAFTGEIDGAVLSDHAFVIRFLQDDPRNDRLLVVNLGPTFAPAGLAEPLIAPPAGTGWRRMWSSEDPRYGGHGTSPAFTRERTAIPARAALVFVPDPAAAMEHS